MKKLLILTIVLAVSFSISAQNENDEKSSSGSLYAAVNVGLPIGDAGDWYSFSASADVSYLFDLSDDFKIGATTGYANWFGKDGGGDLQFVPIAATLEYDLSDDIAVGGDVGYAINVGIGGGGDLYFKPYATVKVSDKDDVTLSYANINGGGSTWSTVQVGYRRNFGWRSVLKR